MLIEEVMQNDNVDFSNTPSNYFLLGLLSAFENRFQAMADNTMQEISWKQFFAIICINMCKEPPTLKELSDILGSSHQNVKQILLKLEKKNFIQFQTDDADKRKQRIVLTDYCREYCERNDEMSKSIMEKMFDGVTEKEVATTIQTIIKIEKNLRGYEGMKKRKKMIVLISIAVVLLLVIVWFCIPYSPLKADFEKDVEVLQTENRLYIDGEVFTAADFEDFPIAIRKYIENNGYIGKSKMNSVRMEYHDVAFSQGRNGPNLTIDYTQNDYVGKPARLALIESSMFGIPFQGYDYYLDGKGGMKGVIAKLITIFDQTGEDMDRACLATFLAESMFVPTVLLQDYIEFEEISEYQVKATIIAYNQTVSGIFTFNENYKMVSFCTNDRAVIGTDGTAEYVPWSAVCGNYRTGADGINHPTSFQAVWNYQDGDFVYFDGIISDITYE